jgi:hypothetical protein
MTTAQNLKYKNRKKPSLPQPHEYEKSSLTDQWPELLKAVDELKPHLDVISEKVDGALQIK